MLAAWGWVKVGIWGLASLQVRPRKFERWPFFFRGDTWSRNSCPPSIHVLRVQELVNLGFSEMLNFSACKSLYYTLYQLSVFSLAKSLELILEISAIYRLADNWLICRSRAQCMISNNSINSSFLRECICRYFLQKNVLKKQILLGFCDILDNQGLGKWYQPRPSARLITLTPAFWLFRISQKHRPIIDYYERFCHYNLLTFYKTIR